MKNKESQIKTKHWAIKNQLDYRFFLDKKYLKDLDDKEKKKIKKNLREKQTFIEQMSENDSILHQTVFFNNNKDELSKTRDNLSRLINYQEKGFYLLNGNEVPTTDKSVVEDQIYKKIANQYKFPTYKEQTSYKSHMNPVIFNTREVKPTKLFDASARNTGFSYKSRKSDLGNQSNFGNKTFYEKSKIIDKDYISSNTYRELNSFSVFNSKLDRQTANKTCLIGNYLLNTINNLNETLIAKELFKKLSDIDSEDKNKEKLKKLKIWDLNEGYINKIDNEDIKIPQVQIQPQIAPPLSIEINSNNRIFENEDESEEKSKLKAQMEKEEIEKANKLKKSMEAKLISRKEYFSKTEIFLETKLLSLNLKPSCRAQATFTLVDNNIYLFGGIGAGKLNDMWTLEILNNGKKLWKLNNVKGNIPSKRFGHTTVKFNSELIIYGGLSDVDIPKDEIIIYDTTTHTFLCEKTKLSDFSTMRAHHIAQSAGNFMLIYGGVTSKNTPLNDVLLLDLRALVWAEIKTINKKEAAIYNHCSALVVSKDKLSNINFHINMFPEECKKTKLKCEGVYIFGGIEFTQV